ncbi:MAG TPA: trimeric intracellular cation channel family protein [Rhizomicrobium sp.]|nr:trimeric intracellular cation channel family protein [Rhizomicrobium sp.]
MDVGIQQIHLPLQALDYVGVGVFAVTGALAAARKRQDVVTFVVFSIITGMGGGTLRDLLIGAPVFWVHSGTYLLVCIGAALAVWIVGERPWRYAALNWLDALGLAAYASIGAAKALSYGVAPGVAVAMGVMTATFGGILRDIFAGEPSVLLRREIYVTAALLSASVYVSLRWFDTDPSIAATAAFLGGFGLRAGAIVLHWTLPGFEARDG